VDPCSVPPRSSTRRPRSPPSRPERGIAAYSFLGFDAVTTLTEETINPRKTMPKAIMLIALIGGVIFAIVTYATQLVHPGGHVR